MTASVPRTLFPQQIYPACNEKFGLRNSSFLIQLLYHNWLTSPIAFVIAIQSYGHQTKAPKWFCRFSMNSANSEVIIRPVWNMDADLPPCERTELVSQAVFRLLWLRASVIMPRSWLLDGFSTIRAHYSSLGLSCSSLHPSEHAHTHIYTHSTSAADG